MASTTTTNTDGKGTPSPGMSFAFFIFYVSGMSTFGSFVNDMYAPALPSMAKYFGCSVSVDQLGLTMGMIGLAVGQLLMGPYSDKYGRKPVLIWSLVIFCVAAVVSIFSPTIHFFLGCRFFQGVGAAGSYFLAHSCPSDIYKGRMLAKTMAIVGAINGIAPAGAPVIGGVIAQTWGWKAVFVGLIIFAAFMLVLSPKFKETLAPSARQQGSFWKSFGNYKKLLTDYSFMIHITYKGAARGILFAYIASAPFVLRDVFGYTEMQLGFIMGVNSLLVAGGSMLSLKFKPFKRGAFIGAALLTVSVLGEAYVMIFKPDFWSYELLMLPILFALGMIFSVTNTLAMNEGRSYAGDASAVLGIEGYIFGAIVSPLVGIGDVMKSTGYVMVGLLVIVVVCALLSRRIPCDLCK